MELNELDYELPSELIAQEPTTARDGARLLVLDADGTITHSHIRELPEQLRPSLWVANDTRVLCARLRGQKPSGGAVELLLLERLGDSGRVERWRAMGRASKGLRQDSVLRVGELAVRVLSKDDEGILDLEIRAETAVSEAIERQGEMPLPPYIRRSASASDSERYQTMFARAPGAVAAPTAGLHFTPELVEQMRQREHQLATVTLHVGPGTFQPVRADSLDKHKMHSERFEISESVAKQVNRARAESLPVVAVGTTVVRTLESAWQAGGVVPGANRTSLFIKPPFQPKVVDHLLTNFHLPKSTLLALVMAFGGIEPVRRAYAIAVESRYRFFSYGDAMLLRRAT